MSSYEGKKSDLLQRLRKIEGQVRGVQRMILDDRYCVDVLTQLAAISQGIKRVSMMVSESHVKGCVAEALKSDDSQEVIDELVDALFKFAK